MRTENKFGYKVCYQENNKPKQKVHLVTNSFILASMELRDYLIYPQYDRKDKHRLLNPKWHIYEVKTKNEYEKLWKGCPFKDSFSDLKGVENDRT